MREIKEGLPGSESRKFISKEEAERKSRLKGKKNPCTANKLSPRAHCLQKNERFRLSPEKKKEGKRKISNSPCMRGAVL